MFKVKSVAIYKPNDVSTFEKGGYLMNGKEKSTVQVESITVDIFRTVRIKMSDGMTFVFRGFPISYVK